MNDIQNSDLLNRIMDRAELLRKENECSSLTRDYIIVAAIMVMDEGMSHDQDAEEFDKAKELLSGFTR